MTSTPPRKAFAVLVLALLCAGAAATAKAQTSGSAPKASDDLASLVGDWRGESLCQVKPSPCHDEVVVYHIARGAKPEAVTMSADKIVNGEAQNMGSLDCQFDAAKHALTCVIPRGTFHFTFSGNKMEGTLTTTDGVLFRKISAKKQ